MVLSLFFAYKVLYPQLVLRDFDIICKAYTDADQKISEGAIDPIEAIYRVDDIASNLITPYARNAHESIRTADLSQQYDLYVLYVKESGADDWSCEVMKRLFPGS